jgi:hypothetical protein
MPDGRQEMLERFAQTAGQVVTRGLNDLTPGAQAKVATALEAGARFQVVVELDPLRVLVQLVRDDGRSAEVFEIG